MRQVVCGLVLVAVAGCAAVAMAPEQHRVERPAAPTGVVRPGPAEASAEKPAEKPAGTPAAASARRPARAATPRTTDAVPARVSGRRSRPAARVLVPSVRVAAPVVPVRFRGSRLGIPGSVGVVGFWSGGARPGDALGAAVLVGHVSDDRDRPGVLGRVRGVRRGALVVVQDASGRRHRYRVTEVRSYAKAALPRSVFSQHGPHRLVLLTCSHRVTYPGGAFHYARNLVVTARPA